MINSNICFDIVVYTSNPSESANDVTTIQGEREYRNVLIFQTALSKYQTQWMIIVLFAGIQSIFTIQESINLRYFNCDAAIFMTF